MDDVTVEDGVTADDDVTFCAVSINSNVVRVASGADGDSDDRDASVVDNDVSSVDGVDPCSEAGTESADEGSDVRGFEAAKIKAGVTEVGSGA